MFPMASYHTGFPSLSSPKNPPGKHFVKTLGKEEGEWGRREERGRGAWGEEEEHGVATSDTKLLRERPWSLTSGGVQSSRIVSAPISFLNFMC